jgi:hypothetical protein
MKARITDFSFSLGGKQRLTIELEDDFRQKLQKLKDADIDVTIKKYAPRRSLDANAYAWVLIDKLAEEMGLPKTEVYKHAIRGIGGISETVCVMKKAADKLCQVWEHNGIGWQSERLPSKVPDCVNVILYYGSSVYDTRQMSALINSLVEDCKMLGIETKPQEEIESLLKEYDK